MIDAALLRSQSVQGGFRLGAELIEPVDGLALVVLLTLRASGVTFAVGTHPHVTRRAVQEQSWPGRLTSITDDVLGLDLDAIGCRPCGGRFLLQCPVSLLASHKCRTTCTNETTRCDHFHIPLLCLVSHLTLLCPTRFKNKCLVTM